MSMYYKVEVDVTPIKGPTWLSTAGATLEDLGMDIDGHRRDDDDEMEDGLSLLVCFWGHISLSALGPDDKHDEILQKLCVAFGRRVEIETRWLNMDATDWDEIINSKDEG